MGEGLGSRVKEKKGDDKSLTDAREENNRGNKDEVGEVMEMCKLTRMLDARCWSLDCGGDAATKTKEAAR